MTLRKAFWMACLVTVAAAPERSPAGQPGCTSQCFAWQEKSTGPEARSGHAMVFDEQRGVLVLFGGESWDILGDTWERSGYEWRLRDCSGPAPRSGHAMVYDSLRGVTVLFGGSSYEGPLGDTWEWDGSEWALRAVTGPSPRSECALAFDRARGRTVLFGGADDYQQAFGDTWEWDGGAWTLQAGAGPTARSRHVMTYDELRGVTVLYGALSSEQNDSPVWEWDGLTWCRAIPTSDVDPGASYFDAMVYDPTHGVAVLLLQTWCDVQCVEVWEWNGEAWRYREGGDLVWGPNDMAAALDRSQGVIQMFGGITIGEQTATIVPSDDLWELDVNGWTLVERGAPAQRWDHAMAFDSRRETTVLFGGNGTSHHLVGPFTWEWDGSSWAMRSAEGPTPRAGHAMVFDSRRSVTVLFGGGRLGSYIDPLVWEWNGLDWLSRLPTGPSARADHAMAYDASRGVTVLFGGYNLDAIFGDTWEWDGLEWRFRTDVGPEPRSGHAMAFDSARGVTVLFGGTGADYYGDTWEWDGTTWSLRSTDGPSPRENHAMVYDERGRQTLLFGGDGCSRHGWSCGDTWAWNGIAWTLISLTGPTPRMGHAMAYDSRRNVSILFGGRFLFSPSADTWELATDSVADMDQDGVLDECDQCPTTPVGFGADETGCMLADIDRNGDVDLRDYAEFQNCWSYVSGACGRFDFDHDWHSGSGDLQQFLDTFTGPRP